MNTYGYPNLCKQYRWKPGIYRATGYQHPWIVVFKNEVVGAWSRAEARRIWNEEA